MKENRVSELNEIMSPLSRRSRVADDFHEITGTLKTVCDHLPPTSKESHTILYTCRHSNYRHFMEQMRRQLLSDFLHNYF